GEQASTKRLTVRSNRILLLQRRHIRIKQCGNFVHAVLDQTAAFRHAGDTESLRYFQVTLKLLVDTFSIRRDQRVGNSTHRRHDDYNRRVFICTHDLNGAFESGCIADGGAAELEYSHSCKQKSKLNHWARGEVNVDWSF